MQSDWLWKCHQIPINRHQTSKSVWLEIWQNRWNFIVPEVAQNWRTWQQSSGVWFWFNRITHLLCPVINAHIAEQSKVLGLPAPTSTISVATAQQAKQNALQCHNSVLNGHGSTRQKLLWQLSSHGLLAGKNQQRPRTEWEETLGPSPAFNRSETPQARLSWAAGMGFFGKRSSSSSCSLFWQH